MARGQTASRLTVLAVVLGLVLVPMPTLATHNSFGPDVHVVQPDEFDPSDGSLVPDIPSGEVPYDDANVSDLTPDEDEPGEHPFVMNFHENLISQRAPSREAPPDQTGESYTQCTTFGTAGAANYAPWKETNDQCFIGYFDSQVEYLILSTFLQIKHFDLLYPVNPAPGDESCTGEDTKHTGPRVGIRPVDVALGRADSVVQGYLTGEDCTGFTHTQYQTSSALSIDTDLLSGQGEDRGGEDGTGATDVMGTQEGSSTLAFPFLLSQYTYVFGEPHPDAPNSNIGADELPFGVPNAPLLSSAGACGQRTEHCQLLTPGDLMAYDDNDNNNVDDVARLCIYTPQFSPVTPGGRASGPCGIFGSRIEDYVGVASAGGFGISASPDTFFEMLPGWYDNLVYITPAPTGTLVGTPWTTDGLEEDYFDDEKEISPGLLFYTAVNPKVPSATSQVWCARIGFIGQEGNVPGTGLSDRGLYDYEADAIDSDIYSETFRGPAVTVRDLTHDPVRNSLEAAQSLAQNVTENTSQTLEQVLNRTLVNETLALLENVSNETVNQLENATEETTTRAGRAVERADYFESEEVEAHVQNGTANQDNFQRDVAPGLRCDAQGAMRVREDSLEQHGGVRFNMDLNQQTVNLKDPTLFGEPSPLPAQENQTKEGHWQTDAYSFGGTALAVIDSNGDGDFDNCAEQTGQPQPQEDFCPWRALWDVYRNSCSTADQTPCDKSADRLEYNLNLSDSWPNKHQGEDHDEAEDTTGPAGVGLYAVAKVTGPLAIIDEDAISGPGAVQNHTHVLGDESSLQTQHCIIGVSQGFEKWLPTHVGTDQSDNGTIDKDDKKDLCPDQFGPGGGEIQVVLNAFDAQGGANGGFSGDINIVKLLPTPKLTDPAPEDSICVTGVWTVDDGEIAKDTAPDAQEIGNNNDADDQYTHTTPGGVSYTAAYYEDCDTFETGKRSTGS